MSYQEAVAQLDEVGKARLAELQAKAHVLWGAELKVIAQINRPRRGTKQAKLDALEADRKALRAQRDANLVEIRAVLYPVVEA